MVMGRLGLRYTEMRYCNMFRQMVDRFNIDES